MVALIIYCIGTVTLLVLPSLSTNWYWMFEMRSSAVLRALFPLTIGYLILRRGLWDVSVVVRRAVSMGAVTLVMAALYVGTLNVLTLSLGSRLSGEINRFLAALVMAAAFSPIWTWADRQLDRWFFATSYDPTAELKRFGDALALHVDQSQVDASIRRLLTDTVSPTFGALYLSDSGKGTVPLHTAWEVDPAALPESLDIQSYADAHFGAEVGKYQPFAALLPLRSHQHIVGVLALGGRQSERPYSDVDQTFLGACANQLGLAIDRASLLASQQTALADTAAALQARETFLSIASHELRTPLTTIRLQIESALRREEISSSMAPRFQRLRRGIERLTQLVESMLDVSRIQAGRFQFRKERANLTFQLATIVDDISDATGVPVTLHAEPLYAEIDPAAFDLIASNLLHNAVRYGGGNPIETTLQHEGDLLRLSVRDHGSEFPKRTSPAYSAALSG